WARLLPFSYVTWAPARLFVAFSWERFFQVMPVQLIWTAAAAALALALYRAGARRLTVQGG
ncbi:MAG: ABC transporter permease, partial [Clostridiales bacterium]|nr:ABC transporter permease [Clostridiales bacterium]